MSLNPNPFDVEALEKSVNESAVRVSSIWVSFLFFGLYLIVAAGGTTHRQLLLEEPIKMPVLSIDLSVVGFYVLAPLLFLIFHIYLLVQVLLLARTAAVTTKLSAAYFQLGWINHESGSGSPTLYSLRSLSGPPASVKACSAHCSDRWHG